MGILGAVDPSPFVAGGVTIVGTVGAVIATMRYIKRTEDDSVDGLRASVKHLEAEVLTCREESRGFRKQIEVLVRLARNAGIPIPDDFWD